VTDGRHNCRPCLLDTLRYLHFVWFHVCTKDVDGRPNIIWVGLEPLTGDWGSLPWMSANLSDSLLSPTHSLPRGPDAKTMIGRSSTPWSGCMSVAEHWIEGDFIPVEVATSSNCLTFAFESHTSVCTSSVSKHLRAPSHSRVENANAKAWVWYRRRHWQHSASDVQGSIAIVQRLNLTKIICQKPIDCP